MGKVASHLMTAPPRSRFPLNPDFIWLHTDNGTKIPISCISQRGMTTQNANPNVTTQEDVYRESEFLDWTSYKTTTELPDNGKYYVIFSHANAEDIYLITWWITDNILCKIDINAIVYGKL